MLIDIFIYLFFVKRPCQRLAYMYTWRYTNLSRLFR